MLCGPDFGLQACFFAPRTPFSARVKARLRQKLFVNDQNYIFCIKIHKICDSGHYLSVGLRFLALNVKKSCVGRNPRISRFCQISAKTSKNPKKANFEVTFVIFRSKVLQRDKISPKNLIPRQKYHLTKRKSLFLEVELDKIVFFFVLYKNAIFCSWITEKPCQLQ